MVGSDGSLGVLVASSECLTDFVLQENAPFHEILLLLHELVDYLDGLFLLVQVTVEHFLQPNDFTCKI